MRIVRDLNRDWLFSKNCKEAPVVLPDGEGFEHISLPHTWNATDGQSGEPFERGAYWYVTEFESLYQPVGGGRLYVEIGAAALYSEVYVNGMKCGSHTGGYSAYRADITSAVTPGKNVLAILTDNTMSDKVYPQTGDFILYGGLYRYVRLISVPESSISLEDHGGSGIYIDSECVEGGARLSVQVKVDHPSDALQVGVSIFDAEGKEKTQAWEMAEAKTRLSLFIPDARRWDGVDDPYLYTARVQLTYFDDTLDETAVRFGIRGFRADPEHGFFLNGRSYPLRGVCMHQDRLYQGNAVSKEEHEEDVRLIAEMGVNCVRLAHYQHSQETYDACDRAGLMVWTEIPYFARSWDDDAHESAKNELRELIAQNYNHPGVFCWGLSNEIHLMGNESPKMIPCHEDLNRTAKEMDPGRLTVIATEHGIPDEDPIHTVADAEGYNHYYGWYRGELSDLGRFCDDFHAAHPERILMISEYGCDGLLNWHSDHPVKRDYTEEYQVLLHESALRDFESRPFVLGTFVWNMFDFGSFFRREGGTKGRNNKGLVTLDRKTKKDAYYVYKAWFSKEPFIHIDGKRFTSRPGSTTTIRIHSNLPEISLYADGKLIDTKQGDKVYVFENVPISKEGSVITAYCGEHSNSVVLRQVGALPGRYSFDSEQKGKDAQDWIKIELDKQISGNK